MSKIKPQYDVYISYRRRYGGWEIARLINEALKKEGISTFIDMELNMSEPFADQLLKVITNAKYVIVILTRDCLDRCNEEHDWLREELKFIRKLNKPICPIFTNDFKYPKQIPESIKFITTMHGLLINEWNWADVISHIATAIDNEKAKIIKNKIGNKESNLYSLLIKKGIYYIINYDVNKPLNKDLLNKYKQVIKDTFNVSSNKIKVLSIDLDKKMIKELGGK